MQYYGARAGSDSARSPIEGKIISSTETPLQYLSSNVRFAMQEKNFAFADKLIQYCEKCGGSPVEMHFFYLAAHQCYYKQRDIRADAIDRCKEYCRKDIALFPSYSGDLLKEFDKLPQCPAFQQLSIIYDKEGNYQAAINVCKLALSYGLDDGTKGGFEGRLQKLEKKLK